MTLSDLAKYSMTRSIAQSLCGIWASCGIRWCKISPKSSTFWVGCNNVTDDIWWTRDVQRIYDDTRRTAPKKQWGWKWGMGVAASPTNPTFPAWESGRQLYKLLQTFWGYFTAHKTRINDPRPNFSVNSEGVSKRRWVTVEKFDINNRPLTWK